MTFCIHCARPVQLIDNTPGQCVHPTVEDCLTQFTDRFGIPIEANEIKMLDTSAEGAADIAQDPDVIELDRYPRTDVVLQRAFDELDVPRLGGQSSGRGWTGLSLFQRCPHAWMLRHMAPIKQNSVAQLLSVERESLAVGTLIHTFLALHYSNMVNGFAHHHITPEQIRDRALHEANPKFVHEGWRCFVGYRLHYQDEEILPLAIELDSRNPRTNESCRYDLIAFLPNDTVTRPAGTYNIEHKSAGRFDRATVEGWANDGEVLGQMLNWREMRMEKRFGELQGTLVNIVGKQIKEQLFHRQWVPPQAWQIDAHSRELKEWEGMIQLAIGTKRFTRARANCIHRWGMCDYWESCATGENE